MLNDCFGEAAQGAPPMPGAKIGALRVGITLVEYHTPGQYHTGRVSLRVGITPSCEALMCMFSGSTPATGKNAVRLFHFLYMIQLRLHTFKTFSQCSDW